MVRDMPLPGAALQLLGMQKTTARDFPPGGEVEVSSKNTSQHDCYETEMIKLLIMRQGRQEQKYLCAVWEGA